MAIALDFNSRTSMKTLDSQCDCNNEKAPTISSCKINVCEPIIVLYWAPIIDNPIGWFNSIFR
jgi:hypothetical protein